MKKGTYYIGDLCYIIKGENWGKLLIETDYFSNLQGLELWAHSTAWGDGTYDDQTGRLYPVDSGTLGCIPIENCDLNGEYEIIDGKIQDIRGLNFEFVPGHIVTFDEDFECSYNQGTFQFGNIIIETGDDLFEDDYEE